VPVPLRCHVQLHRKPTVLPPAHGEMVGDLLALLLTDAHNKPAGITGVVGMELASPRHPDRLKMSGWLLTGYHCPMAAQRHKQLIPVGVQLVGKGRDFLRLRCIPLPDDWLVVHRIDFFTRYPFGKESMSVLIISFSCSLLSGIIK